MNKSMTLPALLATLVISAPGPAHAISSLCDFEDIAIFAFNSAHISRDASVTGDVVANTESPGPVLNDGAEVALDRGCTVTGNVSGHTIHLDSQSTIEGDATYAELVDLGGTITGVQRIVSPPYIDVPGFQQAAPGGDDVFVGAGETVILGDERFCAVSGSACAVDTDCPAFPGDPDDICAFAPVTTYGDILISGGGTLVFSGGRSFDVRSIGTASGGGGNCPFPCRSVEFDAPTDLRVEGRIDTGKNSFAGPAEGSGIGASDIVIYAGGVNGGAGGPLDTPFAVNIGQSSTVKANIYAPNGTIEIDKNSIAEGAFIGKDVEIQRAVKVTDNSAFANEVPIAIAKEVLTDGSNDLVITLEGTDPEGDDLTFSIEVDPTEGTLGSITPIVPAPVNQCSQSAVMCSLDTDCPGFAEGETCDTVQPPITQATVTYTPDLNGNCVTDPGSGEVTCPEDFFTFGVTDICSALGTAIVSINGGTDEVPDDPGTGVDAVEANDLELDAIVNEVKTITLSAAAQDTVLSLTFRVETLPTGALEDSDGTPITLPGTDLPSPAVTYQAPASPGIDSFTFSARDSSTTIPPACGSPSCDTGTVNIDVGDLPELAPDQQVGTDLNQPVEITLLFNDGGASVAPLAPVSSVAQPKATLSGVPSGAGNGQLDRGTGTDSGELKSELPSPTALTITNLPLVFDAGWSATGAKPPAFFWSGTAGAAVFADDNYTFTGSGCLSVTDDFNPGDQFRIYDNGEEIMTTPFVVQGPSIEVGPDTAFADPTYSSASVDVGDGAHDITIEVITNPFGGGRGYIRVDSGACLTTVTVWTITKLPENGTGTLKNLDGTLVAIGDTYLTTPTVVFTPATGFFGSASFKYQVAQGATVDTATVEILVSSTDPCILVGREPGCIVAVPLPLQSPDGSGGSSSAIEGGSSSASSTIEVESTGSTPSLVGSGTVAGSGAGVVDAEAEQEDVVRDRHVHGTVNQPVTFDLGL